MSGIDDRAAGLAALRADLVWDVLVIGGGASGLGAAVDAAARGYRTLLLERYDFVSGTSSRSTKLIHGGVRYLRQGNLTLVRQALRERARLVANAGHLVHPLAFVIPAHGSAERLFYGAGLKLYDLLAEAGPFAASCLLDRAQTLAALPGLDAAGISGGVQYWDGQFDDARLGVALMRTAKTLGATCLNYLPVHGLLKAAGRVQGVHASDAETGESFELRAHVVINATGVYADAVRRFDLPEARPVLTPSQGIHLVLDASFMPGRAALLLPNTDDGRVMFAIPWQGKLLLGTTDTGCDAVPDEPQPLAAEVEFLLQTAGRVLRRAPKPEDIRSAFAGLRPLLQPGNAGQGGTATLSREHAVLVSAAGLVTVTGGKWTTYRLMAEQVIDRAAQIGGLARAACPTAGLKLHGWNGDAGLGPYGSDAAQLASLPGAGRLLHPDLDCTEAMARFALRFEAARTIDDILARRSRALFLDARAAEVSIAAVADLVDEELQPGPVRLTAMVATARSRARACQLA